ncbi:transposase [Streptomyces inhibens]|uniref:transposase n=1 Tax=Streptomyces inhibens TaxID=2293571 RepID=UPI001FD00920|nr:transposase [Streptomyces inhibens]
MDSQSVRAAANIPRPPSGWDGGKKAGGRKRHVVVDCLGLVLAVLVTAASVQDRDAAAQLLERLRKTCFSIRLVRADGGYTGRLATGRPRNSGSPFRSSNAPTTRRGSWCFRAGGWWKER